MTCSVVSRIYTPKGFAGGVSSSESKQSDGINNIQIQIQILEILLASILVATGHIDITKRLGSQAQSNKETKPSFFILFHHKNQSSGEERMRMRTESAPDISALAKKKTTFITPGFLPPPTNKKCTEIP